MDGTTTAGMFGVMATKRTSRIGEFGPENTSLTAATIDPFVPSYVCGLAGPAGAPATVMGPSRPAIAWGRYPRARRDRSGGAGVRRRAMSAAASGTTPRRLRRRGRRCRAAPGEPVELERPVQRDRDRDAGSGGDVAGELLPLEHGVARGSNHVDAPPLHHLGDLLSRGHRQRAILLDHLQGEEAAFERLVDARSAAREHLRVLVRRGQGELDPVVDDVALVQV